MCSVYHLDGPVSVVAALAPMNGFVAAATLKYPISHNKSLEGYLFILLLSVCLFAEKNIIIKR